ncbi:uncharacterized protein [Physcomitrium patens]|uniref:uncharacterized protein isoform X3 n=1 Tax=Physcomitrium patens TaxID=3218 RepID=UPI003CCD8138
MPILKYRTLLLLTMFTFLAVAGRNIPAAVPSTAIFAPTTKVKLTPTRKLWFGVVSWAQSGSQSQESVGRARRADQFTCQSGVRMQGR